MFYHVVKEKSNFKYNHGIVRSVNRTTEKEEALNILKEKAENIQKKYSVKKPHFLDVNDINKNVFSFYDINENGEEILIRYYIIESENRTFLEFFDF